MRNIKDIFEFYKNKINWTSLKIQKKIFYQVN